MARAPRFALRNVRKQALINSEPYARWRNPGGRVAVEFYSTPVAYTIRFLERADFIVDRGLGGVIAWPTRGTSEPAVTDLYHNQVLPLLSGQQGALIIHASAVAEAGGVLGFVAPTGRGKSTLAAAFARAGTPFLSDDGLTLEREAGFYLAHPNRPSFRLWHDSEAALQPGSSRHLNEKTLVEAGPTLPFHAATEPLAALYLLGTGEAKVPTIVPLEPQRAIPELLNHCFLLDVTDKNRLKNQFERVAKLGEEVACFSLDYPREYQLLPDVISKIREHAIGQAEKRWNLRNP
jgi:hypothetical protein